MCFVISDQTMRRRRAWCLARFRDRISRHSQNRLCGVPTYAGELTMKLPYHDLFCALRARIRRSFYPILHSIHARDEVTSLGTGPIPRETGFRVAARRVRGVRGASSHRT